MGQIVFIIKLVFSPGTSSQHKMKQQLGQVAVLINASFSFPGAKVSLVVVYTTTTTNNNNNNNVSGLQKYI